MPIVRVDKDVDHHTMTVISTFASTEDMKQLLDMGMDEGTRQAMNQIDDVLAAART